MEDRLTPAFEDSLRGKGSFPPAQAFDVLLQTSNGCHEAAAHVFIVVEKHPYYPCMQSFAPLP